MKKLLMLVMCAALAASVCACRGDEAGSTPAPEPASAPASEPASEPSSADADNDALVMPVVAGSNAYDVTTSLEGMGIECERTAKNSTDGYYFEGSDGAHTITVETDKDYAVGYIRADFAGSEYDGYLGFVASFPRDDGTSQDAMDWVNENYGTDASNTFGDATYELHVSDNGGYLTIKAAGYDDYSLALLEAAG